ncbi:MAG: type IV pilus secretin PilQ [Burkholderiales bacterium]|nr:type IV pilus secretin PilQ [Burkholderiales bacterium]
MKIIEETHNMFKWRAALAAFATWAVALLAPTAAWAEPAIQSITSSQQSGSDVVRVEFSEPLAAVPNGFVVQTPPRVAIDLPGVGNAMGLSSVDVNQGNLRSVKVAQSGDRTRLVLNLKQASGYHAELDGKVLLLVLDTNTGTATAAAPAAQAANFAPDQNTGTAGLRDIDFRRGADGAGRIIVSLPNPQVGVDIRQQGKDLVVEFLHSTLPERLRRRLDVTDFGTPVKTVSAYQSGDRVRLVVEPTGVWEQSAYQTDNQFVLEVRAAKVDPNKLTQGPGYQGEKLSLNFQNIEVRALLQVIADFTNFNVVTSDTVTGTVTLRLKDVPWDQALDIILQSKGLGVRKTGNVLWIAPKDEIAAKEQAELESRKKVAELEPLRTQSFQLNYTKAETVARSLTGQSIGGGSAGGAGGAGGGSGTAASRILSPRGSVLFESRTNQLFVSDIPSKLDEISQLIAKIDIPVRQVLIEARIVEADDNFGKELGVKLGANDLRGINGGTPGYRVGGNNYLAIGGNYDSVGSATLQPGATSAFTDTQFVNLPANSSSSVFSSAGAVPSLALALFSSTANRFLNLELSALEADGKGNIVSSPRVITADQQKAHIEQGTQIPYQVATSSGATSVQFQKAVLSLDVTPQITPEGNVILDLEVNNDQIGANTTAGPAINTKRVQTQVLVENGGTIVIGGIFTQTDLTQVNKVPLLGDLPVLGYLFQNRSTTTQKSELLIFITPKIVTDRAAVR